MDLGKWNPWKNTVTGLVGVEITSQGIALAHVDGDPSAPRLGACELLLSTDDGLPAEQFRERVEQLQLVGGRCNLVLPTQSYSLLLVEAPNVPDEEMRDAVRFRIKDMISFPLTEALVDVFPLPVDSTRSGRRMLYVVVAQESEVRPLIDIIEHAQLQLNSIDITEMALRNIANGLASEIVQDSRGVGLVRLEQGRGMLTLLHEGQLYLSRQFELPYNAGLLDDLPEEQLLLELQRSLDYYERQMGQLPPGHLYLCGENVTSDKVSDQLASSLSARLSILDIASSLVLADGVDESLLALCAPAIGGALRRTQAA